MRISPSPMVTPIGAKFAFPSSLRVVTIVSVITTRDLSIASSVNPVKHSVSHVAEAKVGDDRAMASAGDPVGQYGRADGRFEPLVFLGRHIDLKAPPKAVSDLLFPPPGHEDGLDAVEG